MTSRLLKGSCHNLANTHTNEQMGILCQMWGVFEVELEVFLHIAALGRWDQVISRGDIRQSE